MTEVDYAFIKKVVYQAVFHLASKKITTVTKSDRGQLTVMLKI